ncbi:MAG: TldD/PmbA family protein [Clostridia bacterium]|nr:TldD/PmbA family protein [Clostridia bacterium]
MNQTMAFAALEAALAGGGDFAEIYFEDTVRNSVRVRDGKTETALSGRDYGAGVRVMRGTSCAYAYSCEVTEKALREAAQAAAQALRAAGTDKPQTFVVRPARPMQAAMYPAGSVGLEKYAALAKSAYEAARAHDTRIVQAMGAVSDVYKRVIVANSLGVYVEDDRARSRLAVQAVAAKGNEMQTGFEGPGAGAGFEFLEGLDIEAYAKSAARTALTMIDAPFCLAGQFPVAVNGGFGGVIFHEACGHSLEATSVARGHSEFCGKLGQKIASDKVTAIDDGSMPGEWGSLGYDDEGTPTGRTVLIENGVLKNYMIDILGGRRMNMAPTGNGRRESYSYAPTSRMTNTFIAAGTDEDMITGIDTGLYAHKMGGGSVNPLTGEFNFAVEEGYWIKDGKIDRPVRGATLIGKGSEVLQRIDSVGREVVLGQGLCGSISGSVPTNVGQPLIRVSRITVGGREA